MSREYEEEEVREMFLRKAKQIAEYWANLGEKTDIEKTEGAIFSLLVTIDGGSGDLPGFILAPLPHEDDKKYLKKQEENYFPTNHKIEKDIKCNIAGGLHDKFINMR